MPIFKRFRLRFSYFQKPGSAAAAGAASPGRAGRAKTRPVVRLTRRQYEYLCSARDGQRAPCSAWPPPHLGLRAGRHGPRACAAAAVELRPCCSGSGWHCSGCRSGSGGARARAAVVRAAARGGQRHGRPQRRRQVHVLLGAQVQRRLVLLRGLARQRRGRHLQRRARRRAADVARHDRAHGPAALGGRDAGRAERHDDLPDQRLGRGAPARPHPSARCSEADAALALRRDRTGWSSSRTRRRTRTSSWRAW